MSSGIDGKIVQSAKRLLSSFDGGSFYLEVKLLSSSIIQQLMAQGILVTEVERLVMQNKHYKKVMRKS